MNDEFLYRVRTEPRPEFLRTLKGRLDRRYGNSRARRPHRLRALFTGILLAGAAFALGALAIRGNLNSLREFFGAPALSSGHATAGPRTNRVPGVDSLTGEPRTARQLGPWRFAPPPPARPSSGTRSPAGAAAGASSHEGAIVSAPAQYSGSNVVIPPRPRDYIQVVGIPEIDPITQEVARRIGADKTLHINAADTSAALAQFCGGPGLGFPDIVQVSRRISAAEAQSCTRRVRGAIVEVRLGRAAIVVARSTVNGPASLSARALFLALARQIPNPANPASLIRNPNTTWNQVDPAVGYERIEVLGPPVASTAGQLFLSRLVETGCNTFPELAALRSSDPDAYEEACRTLRTDGAYVETDPSALPQRLAINPSTFGIFGYGTFQQHRDGLVAASIDGVQPAATDVASGAYRGAESLYLYVNEMHAGALPVWPAAFVRGYSNVSPVNQWGLGNAVLVPPQQSDERGITVLYPDGTSEDITNP
jgi:phosphate transport system substrate-binding protein